MIITASVRVKSIFLLFSERCSPTPTGYARSSNFLRVINNIILYALIVPLYCINKVVLQLRASAVYTKVFEIRNKVL